MTSDKQNPEVVRALRRVPRPWIIGLTMLLIALGIVVLRRTIARSRCADPQPILIGEHRTGFERCRSGLQVRRTPVQCPSFLPRRPDPDHGACSDAKCNERPYGYCMRPLPFGEARCMYGCTLDSDCGTDGLCLCDEPVGRCVKASCRAASDCLTGVCAENQPSPGCWFDNGFACTATWDECLTGADCSGGETCGWQNGHRVCTTGWCWY